MLVLPSFIFFTLYMRTSIKGGLTSTTSTTKQPYKGKKVNRVRWVRLKRGFTFYLFF